MTLTVEEIGMVIGMVMNDVIATETEILTVIETEEIDVKIIGKDMI